MKTKPLSRSPGKLLEGIEAVSLDAGFTLIYTDPPVGEVYASIAARFGYSLDPEDVHNRFVPLFIRKNRQNRGKREDNALADEERCFLWWKEVFTESIGDIMAREHLDPMFNAVYQEYARADWWGIFPDVIPVLSALREKGMRLVVMSNWDHRLNQTLEELGLASYFEKIYISTLIGFAKPDPAAFTYILEDLNLAPGSLLHVGDTPEEDVTASKNAGARAVLLDREGKGKNIPEGVPVISSLSQLLD